MKLYFMTLGHIFSFIIFNSMGKKEKGIFKKIYLKSQNKIVNYVNKNNV